MVSGVGSYANYYATQAVTAAQANRAAAPVTGAEGDFSIPESALRAEQNREMQQIAGVNSQDPARDSVQLSQTHPQLLVSQNYAPTPAQQVQQVMALADEAAAPTTMDRRGDDATGAASELAVEEGYAIAGEDEESEATDETGEAESGEKSADPEKTKANGQAMSEEELQQVRELADRDREVRAHEQAHKSVGGQYAGGMSFEYQQGPDGNRYAVGGEVSIDTSPERDPNATISKMRQVRAAAMAPAEPSGQDRSVAAAASAKEAEARKELAQQTAEAAGAASSGQQEEETSTGDAADKTSGVGDTGAGSAAELSSNPYVERYRNRGSYPFTASPSDPPQAMANMGYRSIDVVA